MKLQKNLIVLDPHLKEDLILQFINNKFTKNLLKVL